ncbi:hypothetical protein [Microbacterium sp. P02]|uniref:hypothetical protein n=1 Tax=Microbacterium sp. P02 TaxID=3366260 RepID=UPI00366DEB72
MTDPTPAADGLADAFARALNGKTNPIVDLIRDALEKQAEDNEKQAEIDALIAVVDAPLALNSTALTNKAAHHFN